jgi:hypothetical protein
VIEREIGRVNEIIGIGNGIILRRGKDEMIDIGTMIKTLLMARINICVGRMVMKVEIDIKNIQDTKKMDTMQIGRGTIPWKRMKGN